MGTQINVNCECGRNIGYHYCTMDWVNREEPEPESRWSLDEIQIALTDAMGGILPQYVWDNLTNNLESWYPR